VRSAGRRGTGYRGAIYGQPWGSDALEAWTSPMMKAWYGTEAKRTRSAAFATPWPNGAVAVRISRGSMPNSRRSKRPRAPRPPMDYLTAAAFAREAFDKLHPTVPPKFWNRASAGSYAQDRDRNFIVGYVWQRKSSTTGAESFFEVLVNAWTAETTVLKDTPLDDFRPEDFEEYFNEIPDYPPSTRSIETIRVGDELFMPLEVLVLEHRDPVPPRNMYHAFKIKMIKGAVDCNDRLTSTLGHDVEILGIQLGSHVWGPDICIVHANVLGPAPEPGVTLTGMGRRGAPPPSASGQ